MSRIKTVEQYISKHKERKRELELLREIVLKMNFEETIKWGMPTYVFHGKNAVGIGAFKSYVGLWFFQGALLADLKQQLVNAQSGKTKAMRQWRFSSIQEIDAQLIQEYLQETKENILEGLEIKIERNKEIEIPPELLIKLEADSTLNQAFEQLSRSKKRDYAGYISEAKRSETKQRRLIKIIPMILSGIGLHDQYKSK